MKKGSLARTLQKQETTKETKPNPLKIDFVYIVLVVVC